MRSRKAVNIWGSVLMYLKVRGDRSKVHRFPLLLFVGIYRLAVSERQGHKS